MLLIHLLLLNGFILLHEMCYACFMNDSLGLSNLTCNCICHQILWGVLGRRGKLHSYEIGVAFRFFDTVLVF